MATESCVGHEARSEFAKGNIDWTTAAGSTGSICVALVTSDFGSAASGVTTPLIQDIIYLDGGASTAVETNIDSTELNGTKYTKGAAGVTVTATSDGRQFLGGAGGAPTVTVDTTDNEAELDSTANLWDAIDAGTAAGAVIYRSSNTLGGLDTANLFIAYIHLSSAVVTNGGDLTINWNANGVIRFT